MRNLYIFLFPFFALVSLLENQSLAQLPGDLQQSFATGTGSNGIVKDVHVQSDGKIVITGSFLTYNGTTVNRITRLNADGTIDGTFSQGSGCNDLLEGSVVHSDGKIFIGGHLTTYNGTARSRVARVNSDGTLDTGFDPGTGVTGYVYDVAGQADGKYVVVGSITAYNGIAREEIIRINSDGSLDYSFYAGTGTDVTPLTVIVQDDGKILIGGSFINYNGTAVNGLARLNPDGSIDTGFNSGTGNNGSITCISQQSDGKILIGGSFTSFNGSSLNRIARLNYDGSIDTGFNPGTGANGTIRTLSVQPDGKIMIGGSFISYDGTSINRIARLNSGGSLDTGFNPGTGTDNDINGLAIQDDGKIIASGNFTLYNGTSRGRIARIWGTAGITCTGLNSPLSAINNSGSPGTITWTTPENAISLNNIYAVATFGSNSTTSFRLEATNYGFSVPAANVIDEIQMDVEWTSSNTLAQSAVYLMKTSSIVGSNLSSGSNLPLTEQVTSFSDKDWGSTWTASDINSSGFGAAIAVTRNATGPSRTASVDHIGVKVCHHTPVAMEYSSSAVSQIATRVAPGSSDNQVIKIEVVTIGDSAIDATSFSFNMTGTTNLTDIANAKLFFTGSSNTFSTTTQLGATVASPGFTDFSISGFSQSLESGRNYFWLSVDVGASAAIGNLVDAQCTGIIVDGITRVPSPTSPVGSREILDGEVWKVCPSGCALTSIQAAYNAIPSSLTDDYVIELQSTYTDASEPVSGISFAAKTMNGFYIKVRPASDATGLFVDFDPGSAVVLWALNGATNIIIDGRPGGTGSSKEFTVRNIRTAATIGPTFGFLNAASNNSLKYLNLEGGSGTGVVSFSTSTGATGNNNNQLLNNQIKDYNLSFPLSGVYSSGTAGKNNTGNIIDSCEFRNLLTNVAGTSDISIASNSSGWTITNNHFYKTTNFSGVTASFSVISINAGSNYNVTGNFIGGKSSFCGGLPMSVSGSSDFTAIKFGTGITAGINTISNNTIANITNTSTSTTAGQYPFVGISIAGTANYTVGSSGNGNIIGGSVSNDKIILTNNAASGSNGIIGISNTATGTINIEYNSIAGIKMAGTRSGAFCIGINSNGGTTTINNNNIGSSLDSSIFINNNSHFYGIYNSNVNGITSNNNILQNIYHAASNTNLLGIYCNGGPLTANSNTFQGLTSASDNYSIMLWHAGTTCTANNNNVSDILLSNAGANGQLAAFQFSSTGAVEVNDNIIGSTGPDNIVVNGQSYSQLIIKDNTGSINCIGNTVQNMTLNGTGTGTIALGINISNGLGTVTGNIVRNIKTFGTTPLSTDYAAIGINVYGVQTGHLVSNNTVENITSATTSAISTGTIGIYMGQGTGTVEKNNVSNLVNLATSNSAHIAGIRLGNNFTTGWNVYNNVLNLNNNGNTNDLNVFGIYDNTTGTNHIYHNTVLISGTVSSGTAFTTCFYRDAAGVGIDNVKNNILQNVRTGGTGGHFTEHVASGGTYTSNNNYLEATDPSTLAHYGGVVYNLAGWNGAPVNASNSISGSIALDANGVVTTIPFVGAGKGANLTATVANDKLGITRGVASWMGAFEGQNITTSAISPTGYCAGNAVSVSYTIGGTGIFNGGNIFTAQLSDAAGSFAAPTTIGTLASTTAGTIAAIIPGATPTGSGYLIRVVSSDPVITGSDNQTNLNIASGIPSAPSPAPTATGVGCSGFTANWNSSTGATGYYLDVATDIGLTSFVTGYENLDVGNVTSNPVTGLLAGVAYYFQVRAYNGCGTSGNSATGNSTTTGSQGTYVVTSLANGTTTDGVSLRWAITQANANCGHDVIQFNLGAGGPFTITLTSLLPNLTDNDGVTINGWENGTNDGTPNTIAVFDATTVNPMNPVYKIILGNNNNLATGLVLASNNNIIKGLVLQDFGDGTSSANDIAITISGNQNKILGCNIGIGSDGVTGGTKTHIATNISGANNQIGDGTAAGSNLISGANSFGVNITSVSATGNTVKGNMVGLQKDGSTLVSGGQSDGIVLNTSATLNTIGGSVAGEGNVISGQGSSGLYLNSAGDGSNTIAGNIIGPRADGVTFVTGNTQGNGFWIFNSHNNIIGGNTAAARNIISANNTAGIAMPQTSTGNVIKGNYIGIDKNGTSFITGSTQDYGIRIWEVSNSNTIGGSGAGEGNVISGNADAASNGMGISLESSSASGNTVLGNIIGPQANGISFLTSNAQFRGIDINGSPNNTIGGNTAGVRNIISANETFGINITGVASTGNAIKGNYIGTDSSGTTFIAGNSQDYGIYITTSAASITIGGSASGEGNIISGNVNTGIAINSTSASGNNILGNIIGPQKNGATYVLSNSQDYGIEITGSPNNIIGGNSSGAKNTISANEINGISITGAASSGNNIKGNYIGIAGDGASFITNSDQNIGINITSSADSNNIGGSGAGEGNVISGNKNGISSGKGIYLGSSSASGNTISGNIIGPQADGLTYVASNQQALGIHIEYSPNNIIGGNSAGARNIISANEDYGVYFFGTTTSGNLLKGNYIGINKTGTGLITGSTQDIGIKIQNSTGLNTIGGSAAGEGNVISGNTSDGIQSVNGNVGGTLIIGNIIGPQADGSTKVSNNAQSYGLSLSNSPNNIIGGSTTGERNIISANEAYGVYITGASSSGNVIKGNYVGIDSSGTTRISGSSQDNGVYITSSADSNTIGGNSTGMENVISGNSAIGIYLASASTGGNAVSRNIIGPQKNGTSYLASNLQYTGIYISGSPNNTIGGNSASTRNIISGNETEGINIWGAAATGNIIRGNYIGAGSGLAAVTGSDQNTGISVNSGSTSNSIGGTGSGENNVISYNTTRGAWINGSAAKYNPILRNLIYNNPKGIELVYGANAGNEGKPEPVITVAMESSIAGTSGANDVIEIFKNTSGTAENANVYVGSTTANGSGNWSLAGAFTAGEYVMATSTDATNNTSELCPLSIIEGPLCGTYTVGGVTPNFTSFNEAVSDLNMLGVSCPVIFNVRNGSYNEQIVINNIAGATAANTVIFQSENSDSSLVNLNFNGTLANNYTLKLNDADYVSFKEMTITALDATYGRVVEIAGAANNSKLLNLVLSGMSTASTSNDLAIVYSGTSIETDIEISNNHFYNGSIGVTLSGSTPLITESGTIINNNIFDNQYEEAIELQYQGTPAINYNLISTDSTNNSWFGIVCVECDGGISIKNNSIANSAGNGQGIYCYGCDGSFGNEGLIANNLIKVGTASSAGIVVESSTYLNVYHNSVETKGTGGGNVPFYTVATGSDVSVMNNIFYNSGGGMAISIENAGMISTLDYNDLYTTGTDLGAVNYAPTYANLAAWTTGTGFDPNSVSADPKFFSSTDLHLSSASPLSLISAMDLSSVIPLDFDGEARPFTPWMGADEDNKNYVQNVTTGVFYRTLQNAYDNLATPLTQSYLIEMLGSYTGEASYPLNFTQLSGASSSNTVTIRPDAAGLSIQSGLGATTIDFSGADYVTIDGRVNGSGPMDLIIENTLTSGNTIKFSADATFNTLRYINIKGANASNTNGVINIITTFGVTGNDNNTIEYCDIHDGVSTPFNAIYASSAGGSNDNIVISNNNIYNFFQAGGSDKGIYIVSNSSFWNISNNSFFQTTPRTYSGAATHYAIYLANGNGHIVNNNFIGGASDSCAGSPWTITGAVNSLFHGIELGVGTTTTSSIQGNTIKNFDFSTSSNSSSLQGIWCGIFASAGNINIGNITGNTIGASTGNDAIITSTSSNGALTTGIAASSANTINISNNTVGSISANGTTSSINTSITGINTTQGNCTVSNNFIGSISTANSIRNNSSNVASSCVVNGISNTSGGSITISGNTISNLVNLYYGTSNSNVFGINSGNGTGTISGNTIYNLNSLCGCTSSGTAVSAGGIILGSASSGQSVTGNTIHSLSNSAAGALAVKIHGIFSGSTSSPLISKNNIHSLYTTSTGSGPIISGIYLGFTSSGDFVNNMIRLGIKPDGNSETLNHQFVGIDIATTGNFNFYYNSVYIGGASVGAGATNTFAARRSTTGTHVFNNNIFQNSRSNGAGTGKHYSIGVNDTASLSSDYNLYFANGTGGVFGLQNATDRSSLSLWQTNTGKDGNSKNGNAPFLNPTGDYSLVDLHINPATSSPVESGGITIGGYTSDKDNDLRFGDGGYAGSGSAPDIGADEGEFTIMVSNTITTSATPTLLCKGGSLTVAYTITGTFNGPNIFTAQLSDAAGSYAAPTVIGSVTSTANTSISATIPAGTPTGTGYRIRVVSDDPAVNGSDNGTNIAIPSDGGAGTWTWVGGISNDWFDPCNWDKKCLPDLLSDVVIPGATTNDPTITGAGANCKTITINVANSAVVNLNSSGGGALNIAQ